MIVAPENPAALREAIVGLLTDSERARKMGAHAEREAKTRFTTKILAKALATVFHEIVKQ